MIDTITLKEAARLLHSKDKRYKRCVLKWCLENNVIILKKKYIVRQQFNYAFYSEFIEYLKKTYKNKWQEAWDLYCNENITDLAQLEKRIVAKNVSKSLVPKSPIELEFYEKLYGKKAA